MIGYRHFQSQPCAESRCNAGFRLTIFQPILSTFFVICINKSMKGTVNLERQKQDLIILQYIRQEFWHMMDPRQQGQWAAANGQARTLGRITNKSIDNLKAMLNHFTNPSK